MNYQHISLKILLKRFWKKASLTWLLVILEGSSLLVMPLVIGWAVDGLIKNEMIGMVELSILCIILLIVGAGRRFYDTRVYSGIFQKVSNEMVSREINKDTSVSKISARTNLFTEFIEFLENSIPDIFNHFIGLVGTLLIIFFIEIKVFWVCIIGILLTAFIFVLSQKKMLRLNKGQNDELEKQVQVLSSQNHQNVNLHFKKVMKWNIRLSDLETINFLFTWIALAGALITSVFIVASSGTSSFGHVITIVMYVFGFIESVMAFPLYYQQLIRLHDIAGRLG